MNKLTHPLILLTVLALSGSCMNRQFVAISDTPLNDSTFVFGHVHYVDQHGPENYSENEFDIWLENSA
jgi:hypothetical protein